MALNFLRWLFIYKETLLGLWKTANLQTMALEALFKESKYPSQGVLEEFSKLNQLSSSIVKVWFNNKHQREDPSTSTTAVTANDDDVVLNE